jgi:hypothetical protein
MINLHVLKYESQNLGDDIQSVAVMDILNDLNIKYSLVSRDSLDKYPFSENEKNYVILNGWFTNGYGVDEYYSVPREFRANKHVNLPPKGNFLPIIYSFHISEWGPFYDREVHPSFLSEESANFYRKSLSVGCRDVHTLELMKKINVDTSYFSGCITLSLNKEKYYLKNNQDDYILFVDVPKEHENVLEQKTKEVFKDLEIIKMTHNLDSSFTDENSRFDKAKLHLKKFCNAKLVITTRLHVFLPCLAFGAPVIFVFDDEELNNSRVRDYIKMVNTIPFSQIKSINLNDYLKNKYDGEMSVKITNKFKEIINEVINDTSDA